MFYPPSITCTPKSLRLGWSSNISLRMLRFPHQQLYMILSRTKPQENIYKPRKLTKQTLIIVSKKNASFYKIFVSSRIIELNSTEMIYKILYIHENEMIRFDQISNKSTFNLLACGIFWNGSLSCCGHLIRYVIRWSWQVRHYTAGTNKELVYKIIDE